MNFVAAVAGWMSLDVAGAEDLTEARLQAHWAAQAVAAVGEAWVPPEPDFSHTSMSWDRARGMLLGRPLSGSGLRAGLRFADLGLVILNARHALQAELKLAGRTLAEGVGWFEARFKDLMGSSLRSSLELPRYEMPDHPAAQGEPFSAPISRSLVELGRWYGNAASLMEVVAAQVPFASPVRCWPHHFDIATLMSLDLNEADASAEQRYIGFGLSPGDATIGQPYFYLNPWPSTGLTDVPGLEGGGLWHREGWTGAILPADRLTEDGRHQAEQVLAYLSSALAAARKMLERPGDDFWPLLTVDGVVKPADAE